MRLSEAIRAGAKMKPRGHGADSVVPIAEAVCALGAAACAGKVEGTTYSIYEALKERWPILRERVRNRPGSPKSFFATGDLLEAIWWLNDQDEWPREQIADFVEQAEDEALKCGILTKEQLGYE